MPVELQTAVRSSSAAAKFLLNDLGKTLAALELDAAAEAYRKARLAKDSRSQLWSVINHLEIAEAAARATTSRLYEKLFMVEYFVSHSKLNYILIIMSLIYKVLGEDELCDDTLAKIDPKNSDPSILHWILFPTLALSFPKLIAVTVFDITVKGYDTEPWGAGYTTKEKLYPIIAQIKRLDISRVITQ